MIRNQWRNLKHIKRIHGGTFQAKFPLRVYSKNYFYSGESQFKSSYIFAAAVSNAAFSLFPPETPVFHLDAYSTLHRKILTRILPFGTCVLCDFLHDNNIALTGISKRGSLPLLSWKRFLQVLIF